MALAAAVAGGALTSVANADASLAVLTGTTDLAGAVAYLEVEQPTAFDSDSAPTSYVDTVVDQETTNGSGQFTLSLPDTTVVHDAATNGWVNTLTVVRSGNQSTGNYTPVIIDRTNTVAASAEDLSSSTTVNEGTLAAAQTTSRTAPSDNLHCAWTRIQRSETSTRIGELHVADVSGSSGTFLYHTQTDSTFSVGFDYSRSGWSTNGTYTLSESLGTSADFTDGRAGLDYAIDHMYYGKFQNNGAATCPGLQYQTHVIHSAGDAYRGTNNPGSLPWSSCHADPHGYVRIPANGFFANDRGTAVSYGGVASAFGYSFSGHTGYTDGIHVKLTNNGSSDTYACGTSVMPNVNVLYNRPS